MAVTSLVNSGNIIEMMLGLMWIADKPNLLTSEDEFVAECIKRDIGFEDLWHSTYLQLSNAPARDFLENLPSWRTKLEVFLMLWYHLLRSDCPPVPAMTPYLTNKSWNAPAIIAAFERLKTGTALGQDGVFQPFPPSVGCGVSQPAAGPEPPQPRRGRFPDHREQVEAYMAGISQTADADNGALQEGDSPNESRRAEPKQIQAAQDIMMVFYFDQHGRAITQSKEALTNAITIPVVLRQRFLLAKAAERVGSHPAATGYNRGNVGTTYSLQRKYDELAATPLSDADMKEILAQWKKEFPLNSTTKAKIEDLLAQDTKESKKLAREARRGAWKAYVHDKCISVQLATTLLMHPPEALETLLEHWATYMNSAEHAQEQHRANLPLQSEEKQRLLVLKNKVHTLKHTLRNMTAIHEGRRPNINWNAQKPAFRDAYRRYLSGELQRQVDEAATLHGYGRVGGVMLGPKRLADDFASKKVVQLVCKRVRKNEGILKLACTTMAGQEECEFITKFNDGVADVNRCISDKLTAVSTWRPTDVVLPDSSLLSNYAPQYLMKDVFAREIRNSGSD